MTFLLCTIRDISTLLQHLAAKSKELSAQVYAQAGDKLVALNKFPQGAGAAAWLDRFGGLGSFCRLMWLALEAFFSSAFWIQFAEVKAHLDPASVDL